MGQWCQQYDYHPPLIGNELSPSSSAAVVGPTHLRIIIILIMSFRTPCLLLMNVPIYSHLIR